MLIMKELEDEIDHVLGVIWVIRMVAQCKGYEGKLHVYSHDVG